MGEKTVFNNRALAEGALLSALTIIIYFLNTGIGLISWAVPIPLAIYCFRHGTKTAALCCLVASLLTGMLLGPSQGTTLLISTLLVSTICGVVLKRKLSDFKSVTLVAAAFIISLAINWGITALATNISPLYLRDQMVDTFEESADMLIAQYRAIGIGEEEIATFSQNIEATLNLIAKIFWSLLLLGCISIGVIILNLTRYILSRINSDVRKAKPFSQWAVPWNFIWVLIFGVLLYVIGNGIGNSIVNIIGLNFIVFAFVIYLVGGISLLVYWFKIKKFPVFMLVLLLIVAWLFSLHYAIALLCIADGWLDFRKRITNGETPA